MGHGFTELPDGLNPDTLRLRGGYPTALLTDDPGRRQRSRYQAPRLRAYPAQGGHRGVLRAGGGAARAARLDGFGVTRSTLRGTAMSTRRCGRWGRSWPRFGSWRRRRRGCWSGCWICREAYLAFAPRGASRLVQIEPMLRINHLKLRDFRAIDWLAVEFHAELTVLIAENGVGKSSILDALAVMVAPFVGAFNEGKSRGFARSDIRMVQARQSYLPEMEFVGDGVTVEARVAIPGVAEARMATSVRAKWKRFLDTGIASRTTTKDVCQLESAGQALQACVRPGHPVVTLPVVAYYGSRSLVRGKQAIQT